MIRWWKRLLARKPRAQRWELHHAKDGLVMRRRRPDGEFEYRELTDEEHEEARQWQAIR